jgi:2-polyprenyl-3-methyl-5-hydroxy-6-metoxy-1,4-benzoquinol methylase
MTRSGEGLADYRANRAKWVSESTKLSPDWGIEQARKLWDGLYSRWNPLIDGRVVLDLGCSWGYLLRLLLERHRPKKLIGVDVRSWWTEVESGWQEQAGDGVVEFLEGELGTVPVESGSVDLMLCSSVFQYLPPEELMTTLERAYRMLTPGGELLLRTQLYTSYLGASLHRDYEVPYVHLLHGEDLLRDRLRAARDRRPQYTNGLTASSYLATFAAAGFDILDARRLMNRHAPEVQARVADDFPVSANELGCTGLEARLLRPIEPDELERFAPMTSTRVVRRSRPQP